LEKWITHPRQRREDWTFTVGDVEAPIATPIKRIGPAGEFPDINIIIGDMYAPR
jgi:hypothetical protein